jgi:hypothetical protein
MLITTLAQGETGGRMNWGKRPLLLAALLAMAVALAAAAATSGSAASQADACDGAWTVVTTPAALGGDARLRAVTMFGDGSAWAVGDGFDGPGVGGTQRGFAEHWDGSAWTAVPTPDFGTRASLLAGIGGSGPRDLWAAGMVNSLESGVWVERALVEHWNGSGWSQVDAEKKGTSDVLVSVAAISPSDAWAAGSYTSAGFGYPLVEHWDGLAWHAVPAPAPIDPDPNKPSLIGASLTDISARAADDIWAVGSYYDGDHSKPLTEHWNGSGWTIVPTAPTTGGFAAVATLADGSAWAVGLGENDHFSPPIQNWQAGAWGGAASAPFVTTQPALEDVAALASDDVWAVGSVDGSSSTYISHWDGSVWNRPATPTAGSENAYLFGVAGAQVGSNRELWAVGGYSVGGYNTSLALHRCAGPPTPPASPPAPPPPPPAKSFPRCVVPALRGKTLAQGRRLLRARHCHAGAVSWRRSSAIRRGRILASRPARGARVRSSTRVALVLSSGTKRPPRRS